MRNPFQRPTLAPPRDSRIMAFAIRHQVKLTYASIFASLAFYLAPKVLKFIPFIQQISWGLTAVAIACLALCCMSGGAQDIDSQTGQYTGAAAPSTILPFKPSYNRDYTDAHGLIHTALKYKHTIFITSSIALAAYELLSYSPITLPSTASWVLLLGGLSCCACCSRAMGAEFWQRSQSNPQAQAFINPPNTNGLAQAGTTTLHYPQPLASQGQAPREPSRHSKRGRRAGISADDLAALKSAGLKQFAQPGMSV